MLILGIETSCDETAAAVVRDGKDVLSNIVASQSRLHLPYGGVVPEIACRAHLSAILPVVYRALNDAGAEQDDIDAVAVVNTPGLVGALLIGVTAAKTIAWLHDKPLIGVNHLHAHIYAAALGREEPLSSCVSLVASGGHTSLFHSRSPVEHELLGSTLDDAAGEAFDKVASLLGLGYPGGPEIDRVARAGDPRAIRFPRARLKSESLNFSFSGIKTAVLYKCRGQDVRNTACKLSAQEIADIAAGFQEAMVDMLVDKLVQATRRVCVKRAVVGGGVAANSRLREQLVQIGATEGIELVLPPLNFCIDNAAMVAGLGWHLLRAQSYDDLTLDVLPTG